MTDELLPVCGYKDEKGKFYDNENQYLLNKFQKEYEKLASEIPEKIWNIWQKKSEKEHGKSVIKREFDHNNPLPADYILFSEEFRKIFLPELFRLANSIKKFEEQ